MGSFFNLASILISLLIIILYFLFNKKLTPNVRRSLKYSVIGMALVLSFYIEYIIVYGISFGAGFLQPILLMLPWFIKGENILTFPLYFGGFIFGVSWSLLTIVQMVKSLKNPSSLPPPKSLSILAIFLFSILFLLSILLVIQWLNDVNLVRNRFDDLKRVSLSKASKQLREFYEINIASHDPDIKYTIIAIAGNKFASQDLLRDIYKYAISLKSRDPLRKSILDALSNNPSTPGEILKGILEVQSTSHKVMFNETMPFDPYGSIVKLAENPNTAASELKEIYIKISKSAQTTPDANPEINSKIVHIYEALAKNPNTPSETLKEIFLKFTNQLKIDYLFSNFSENPNLPMDVLKEIIEKINARMSTSENLDSMELGFISNIISHSLRKSNLDPSILQILINLPDCNIRANIFNKLQFSGLFSDVKQEMLSAEQDLGNQLAYKNILGQQAFFENANAPREQSLSSEEGAEVASLRLQIGAISDSQHLEDIFNSINNRNILHHLLSDFSMNCYLSPALLQKIFSIVQGPLPFALKLNTIKALALNPNTPSDILSKILENALKEIQNRNIVWINIINLMALNPNFPTKELSRLIAFPSCSVRINLIKNPVVPVTEIEKMKKDSDYTVRSVVAEVLKDPNLRKRNYFALPRTPACEKYKMEMGKLESQR